jgi:hypothetical protein
VRTPDFYKCSKCQKHGVKLWRTYCSSCVELLCIDCAFEDEKECILHQAKENFLAGHISRMDGKTDRIGGSLVPAIPDEKGSWWGYASVPDEGCRWWHSLEPQMVLGKVWEEEEKWIYPEKEGCPNCGNPPSKLDQPIPFQSSIRCPKCNMYFSWDTKYRVTYKKDNKD